MYVIQKCYVKWANELLEPFTVANNVKQGAVISPLLFTIYIDNLFKEFKQFISRMSCWTDIRLRIWLRR